MADEAISPGVTVRDTTMAEEFLPTPIIMSVSAATWLRFTAEERKHCEAIAERLYGLIEIRSA